MGLAPSSCSSRAVLNFTVGAPRHKIHRIESPEKVFVLKVLYILSLFSVNNISVSGLILSKGKVGQILIRFMKVDAV
jgi:antitoxin component HigA of HigAB toxin-antitoxin module